MDKTDLQIIKELMEDARKPFREIAKKIGVSTQTVIKRYNEMKEKGTIQVCSISIDVSKIGYEGMAFLLISGPEGKPLSDAMERLKKTENIITATNAIGDYEGYAVLLFKSATDLFERIHNIKLMVGIGKMEICYTVPVPINFPISIPPPKKENHFI